MEEHPLVASLAHSRDRLRALMLPKEAGGERDDDTFPRSMLMRVLFDSRLRGLSLSLIASLAAAFLQRRAAGDARHGPGVMQTIMALVGALRSRD